MQQKAKVIAVLPDGRATVSIKRESACGHDCTSCGACGASTRPIVAEVINEIGACVGDNVCVESKTSRILGLAVLVYVVPIVLLLLFYALASSIFKTEWASIPGALLGLVLGVLIAIPVNKREAKKGAVSTIVRVID